MLSSLLGMYLLGKKVNVPSMLPLLTGDMGGLERTAGRTSRSPTLSVCDHLIPAPASPTVSVLGVVPCVSRDSVQTNLLCLESPGLDLERADGFVLIRGRCGVWLLTQSLSGPVLQQQQCL